jgi:hypothetical protein
MYAGLLKRIGLILVAIAFLGGGAPRVTMFATAAAQAAVMGMPAHGMHGAGGGMPMQVGCQGAAMIHADHPGQDIPPGHGKAPSGCDKHSNGCLAACASACTFVADHRLPASGLVWFGVASAPVSPATGSPGGISHKPPLFPPIAV